MTLSTRWRWPGVLSAVLGGVLGLVVGDGVVDALALSALAGIGVTLTLRSLGRRVVGVLISVLGVLVAAAPWWGSTSSAESGFRLAGVLSAGALLALAGVLTVLTAGQQVLASRFEPDPKDPAPGRVAEQHPRDQWRALDRGDDPTTR